MESIQPRQETKDENVLNSAPGEGAKRGTFVLKTARLEGRSQHHRTAGEKNSLTPRAHSGRYCRALPAYGMGFEQGYTGQNRVAVPLGFRF